MSNADKSESVSSRRVKKLTPKAMEQYEANVSAFKKGLNTIKEQITETTNKTISEETDYKVLSELTVSLNSQFEEYDKLFFDFMSYLGRTCTSESQIEVDSHRSVDSELREKVNNFLKYIFMLKDQKFNISQTGMSRKMGPPVARSTTSRSHASGSARTGHSTQSVSSSKLARKQSKAEAAMARISFIEKEAELKRKQSEIEEREKIASATRARQKEDLKIELELISEQKEAAAAVAEAEALEQSIRDSVTNYESLPRTDPMIRTAQYVQAHVAEPDVNQEIPDVSPTVVTEPIPLASTPRCNLDQPLVPSKDPPNVPEQPQISQYQTSQGVANDVTRFLLRKDLAMSRLSRFNDKPENYQSWKSSFTDVTKEIGISAAEEVDLLVKWLGQDSQKHAISLRSAFTKDSSTALDKIWERLDERFGSAESVHHSVMKRLENFPRLTSRESTKLYELADILAEIAALKQDPKYGVVLSYFDSSVGVTPIIGKVPFLQEKWARKATDHKRAHDVAFPPFQVFADFIADQARLRNDPGLPLFTSQMQPERRENRRKQDFVFAKKTEVGRPSKEKTSPIKRCLIHKTEHPIEECRAFLAKTYAEKRDFTKENNLCFKCLSDNHSATDCLQQVKCDTCSRYGHIAAMHNHGAYTPRWQGGEKKRTDTEKKKSDTPVSNKCTQVCGKAGFQGKSCAKIVLVRIHHRDLPERSIITYAIIDDQSNRSLAGSPIFEELKLPCSMIEYTMSSCGGHTVTSGRIADGCVVETLDGTVSFQLPQILECNDIPNVREEIPSPEVAAHHPHLRGIAEEIPPLMEDANILLLIGRDLIEAHHVMDQRIGGKGAPYAQKLGLGWVIVGETCLGKIHRSEYVNVNKTCLLQAGRESVFNPCKNGFEIQERGREISAADEDSIFKKTKDDEKPGLSTDDREFLKVMDGEFVKGPDGKWTAPLPFREDRIKLPNNRTQAERRANILHQNLLKNSTKQEQFIEFMQKTFDKGHAERAPELKKGQECWYLPIFGVHHPQKPSEIRCVFDSSAKHQGVSLNDVLLTGPDLTNSLLGILLRFRKEKVAIMADVEQMFYSFEVQEQHRDFLRFLWYKDNDPSKPLIEYRMCVHVFGNSPSPAVATYGLRKTVEHSQAEVKEFVNSDFYVDDGLTSKPTVCETVDLMKKTQSVLKDGGLRLHKIASNKEEVMTAFPKEDLAKGLKSLDLKKDELPTQRSLGLRWDLSSDEFNFNITPDNKPYTRRGVLSIINSIYDPIGFLAPVTVQGRLILQSLMSSTTGWDERLPEDLLPTWESWKESLSHLKDIRIPRVYNPSFSKRASREVYMFSDASEKAVAAVGYLITHTDEGTSTCSFLLGKAKVAPSKGHTIPRLELCAAVLSIELAEILTEQLGIPVEKIKFYTDSKVVLGYITNKTRRFHTYVSNRVERITRFSKAFQWNYIPTDHNPSDCATRGVEAKDLHNSMWLTGPSSRYLKTEPTDTESFPLVDPDMDKEIRREVSTLKTETTVRSSLGSNRFTRFSSWRRLVEAIARLKHVAESFKKNEPCRGWHSGCDFKTASTFNNAERLILKTVQNESFCKEVECLRTNKPLPRDSPILKLDPYLDNTGLLRVGGRIRNSDLNDAEKNPILVPGKHHIATLLIRFHHEAVQHQGRHFTEGALRSAGLWLIGGKRLVSSFIHKCVKCKKLRGKLGQQKMADLPEDRLLPAPPFTYVGVDAFGPWNIVTRRTRGGQANSKRWCILFTCLTIRAVHVEVVEEMTSSAFINALRRFLSIRGKVKEFRSDRGTNFVGACEELQMSTIKVEQGEVADFIYKSGAVWRFNPPHSSHMGGSWERMIGMVRRILESMLGQERNLTHDVLVTLLAEACAIVNSRPLVPVSCDNEVPEVLSPAKLLTFKSTNDEQSAGQVDLKDTYKKQWKHVKHLADVFWHRWRKEYLQSLQQRRKWQDAKPDLCEGDVVLLKDSSVNRTFWPLGRIAEVYPSSDGRIRKLKVCVVKDDSIVEYIRPVVEVVPLVGNNIDA